MNRDQQIDVDTITGPIGRMAVVRRHIGSMGWGLVAEAVRLPTAIVVFLILTRSFETTEYGVLVGTLAVLGFLVPYATLGSSYLLLQRVAGDHWQPTRALARAFGSVLVGGGLVSVGLIVLRPVILPQIPAGALALLCASEIIAAGLIEAMVFLAQAEQRLAVMAALRGAAGSSRVAAAIGLVAVTDDPPLWAWAVLALGCGVLTAIVGQLLLAGGLVLPSRPGREDVRNGVPYALGFGADKFRDGIDGWLLVRLDRPGDAGIYGAASRIVWTAAAPIVAIISVTNARFFAAANQSKLDARRLARRLTAVALIYAICVAGVFIATAELIVRVLPDSYSETATAIRLISVFPAVLALEVFVGMALTAIGLHPVRVILNLVTAGLNAVLDVLWIPEHGYKGAIVATIIAGSIYSSALWIVLERTCRRQAGPHDTQTDQ